MASIGGEGKDRDEPPVLTLVAGLTSGVESTV